MLIPKVDRLWFIQSRYLKVFESRYPERYLKLKDNCDNRFITNKSTVANKFSFENSQNKIVQSKGTKCEQNLL